MGSRIIIIGAGGRLGAALMRAYRADHDEVAGFNHAQLDLGDEAQLRGTLADVDFDLLINCAAQTNVDRCEKETEEAFALNAEAPRVLAEICSAKNARLIHISTDYVFDGEKAEPYTEEDEPNPISVYGHSKLEGERRVLEVSPEHLVARVSWVFGPDRPSFIDWVIEQAREKEGVVAVADKFSTPTYTHDIAKMLRALWSPRAFAAKDQSSGEEASPSPRAGRLQGGVVHLSNRGQCSWREYGQWALDCCRAEGIALRTKTLGALTLADMKQFIARRPVQSALSTAKYERLTGDPPRAWQDAVRAYVQQQVASTR